MTKGEEVLATKPLWMLALVLCLCLGAASAAGAEADALARDITGNACSTAGKALRIWRMATTAPSGPATGRRAPIAWMVAPRKRWAAYWSAGGIPHPWPLR